MNPEDALPKEILDEAVQAGKEAAYRLEWERWRGGVDVKLNIINRNLVDIKSVLITDPGSLHAQLADREDRLRKVEKRVWALPAASLGVIGAIITALIQSNTI